MYLIVCTILYGNMKFNITRKYAREYGVIKRKNGADVQSLTFLRRCIYDVD